MTTNKPYHYGSFYLGLLSAVMVMVEFYTSEQIGFTHVIWLLLSFFNVNMSHITAQSDNIKEIIKHLEDN